jgi:hypothetical protein
MKFLFKRLDSTIGRSIILRIGSWIIGGGLGEGVSGFKFLFYGLFCFRLLDPHRVFS